MIDYSLLIWLGIVGAITAGSSWLRLRAEERDSPAPPDAQSSEDAVEETALELDPFAAKGPAGIGPIGT